MSADPIFEKALAFVLLHEGSKFVNNPADPGGATKYGISLRAAADLGHLAGLDLDLNHDGRVDAADIADLTQDEAGQLYRAGFWDRFDYGQIADFMTAAKLFDLAVNMGPVQAHKQVQRALRCAWLPVTEDGILGPSTIGAINAAHPNALCAALKSEAAGFYRQLAAVKPALAEFLDGWLNRAYSNPAVIS